MMATTERQSAIVDEADEIAARAWARYETPLYVPWPLLLGAVFVIALARDYIGGRDA